jgi:hypothetical protein
MEAFCREIVSEIRTAKNEKDLIWVIGNSLSLLRRERKSYNEEGYIMNMIASLRATDISDTAARSNDNIRLAIRIFKQFQEKSPVLRW